MHADNYRFGNNHTRWFGASITRKTVCNSQKLHYQAIGAHKHYGRVHFYSNQTRRLYLYRVGHNHWSCSDWVICLYRTKLCDCACVMLSTLLVVPLTDVWRASEWLYVTAVELKITQWFPVMQWYRHFPGYKASQVEISSVLDRSVDMSFFRPIRGRYAWMHPGSVYDPNWSFFWEFWRSWNLIYSHLLSALELCDCFGMNDGR